MAAIVERVKDKVRGRSRSRRSLARGEERTGDETHDAAYAGARDSRNLEQDTAHRVSSPTMPAWHVHKTNRNSSDLQGAPQVPPIDPQYHNENAAVQPNGSQQASYGNQHTGGTGSESVPARYSSLHNQPQSSEPRTSEGLQQAPVQYPYTVPRRKESLPQNRVGRESLDKRRSRNRDSLDQSTQYAQPSEYGTSPTSARISGGPAARLPDQPMTNDLGTEIDQALASMSVNDRAAQQTNGYHTNSGPTPESLEHLRLPEGFKLGHSVRTSIDTEWKPAVTHEHKYHERTEIIREAITRDIHIHHYYTYLQPIKVVEVLPPKHYRIDEKTGLKVEISAPAGWKMPDNLQPRQEDHGFVKGWERHYLVNEQHPNGTPEPAPSHREHPNQLSSY